MPAIGELAPDFEMLTDEGKSVKLSDFRGKTVILYFYPKDFTSGCELQACAFRNDYAQIEAKNAIVLGASGDDVESHQKFREALNLPFHLLVDADFQYAKAWNAYGSKTYGDGKSYTGILRSQFVIDPEGRIIDVQTPVAANESAPLALKIINTV